MSSPNSKVAWTRRRTNGETHVPFPLLVEQRPAPQGVERVEVLPAGHVERRTQTAVRLGEQLPEPRTRGFRWRGSGGALPPGLHGDGEGLGLHRAALHPSSLHAVGARRGAAGLPRCQAAFCSTETDGHSRPTSHELAELRYLRDHPGATYRQAHTHAGRLFDWGAQHSNQPARTSTHPGGLLMAVLVSFRKY